VLLFQGTAPQLVHAIVGAVVGVIALSGALTRYFFIRPLPLWEAVLIGVGGLLLLYPEWMTDLAGLLMITPTIVLTALAWRRAREA
jgi:TRAP-type uncharacterized transport system fused permease subunit